MFGLKPYRDQIDVAVGRGSTANLLNGSVQPNLPATTGKRALVIVCASRLMREGLRSLMEDFGFLPQITTGAVVEFLAQIGASDCPDVGIYCIRRDDDAAGAITGLTEARRRFSTIKWIVITERTLPEVLDKAAEIGVSCLFMDDISAAMLNSAIEMVMMGQTILPERSKQQIVTRIAASAVATTEPIIARERKVTDSRHAIGGNQTLIRALTDRENEILRCLMNGNSNKQIARELEISEATVKVHVKGLLRKMKVANRTQAAIWALSVHGSMECPAELRETKALVHAGHTNGFASRTPE